MTRKGPGLTDQTSRAPLTYEAYRETRYFAGLDGLRGIGVLLVVAVHMTDGVWDWLSGRTALSIFFVLSGYLITTLALREEERRGALSLKAFLVRRTFRLVPAYYAVLVVYCVLIYCPALSVGEPYRAPFTPALPYYLLLQSEWAPPAPYYQSWSLGVEMKYYLLWPFAAFFLLRRSTGRRCALALAAMAVSYAVWLTYDGRLDAVAPVLARGVKNLHHYNTILVGCLLALILEHRGLFERLRVLARPQVATATGACLIVAQLALYHYPVIEYLYPYLLSVALVGVLLGKPVWTRVLEGRWIVFIGTRSYGIYLGHLLCKNVVERVVPASADHLAFRLIAFIATSALSLLAAHLMYVTIERPAVAVGRRWSKRLLKA